MFLFDWRSTSDKTISDFLHINQNINFTNLFVWWVNIDLVTSYFSCSLNEAEVCLFMFQKDPQAFISFKEKIKTCLKTQTKIYFRYTDEKKADFYHIKEELQKAIEMWKKIIVQLPCHHEDIMSLIQKIPNSQDIDNLNQDPNKFGCTQQGIISLANYLVEKYKIDIVTILWSKWFIWTNLELWINAPVVNRVDKIDLNFSEDLMEDLQKTSDLLISTSGSPIILSNNIKQSWVSIIDTGFIRWRLWIRWSIDYASSNINKINFLTPVPWGIWPLEMLFLIAKIKNLVNFFILLFSYYLE